MSFLCNPAPTKFAFLGDDDTGKSSLLGRLMEQMRGDRPLDIWVWEATKNVYSKTFQYESKQACLEKVEIWDHPGDLCTLQRQDNFISSYLKNVDGIFLVYDVTKKSSFEHLTTRWISMLLEDPDKNAFLSFFHTPKVLIGNKCDLWERKVPSKEIDEFCRKFNVARHIETSSMGAGVGITDSMDTLIARVYGEENDVTMDSITSVSNRLGTVQLDWKRVATSGTAKKTLEAINKEQTVTPQEASVEISVPFSGQTLLERGSLLDLDMDDLEDASTSSPTRVDELFIEKQENKKEKKDAGSLRAGLLCGTTRFLCYSDDI